MTTDKKVIEVYYDLLLDLKKETFDNTKLIALSRDALKLVATWRYVDRKIINNSIGNKNLHLCWHNVWFDAVEWAMLANVHKTVVWELFNTLAKQNLIYPDGTVPNGVKEYLEKEAREMMEDDK